MSYQLPPLIWLRAFEASARCNSFTLASQELNLTSAAVSHQVRSLEQHLEQKLFERLPRSLRLTDMGRAYLPSVRRAFDQLSASTHGLFGAKGEQSITVRCTATFSVSWLIPRVKKFRQLYPNIQIRLYTAIWTEALNLEETDLDIRFGDGSWSGYHATLISNEASIAVASKSVAERIFSADNLSSALSSIDFIQIMGCEGRWNTYLDEVFSGFRPQTPLHVDTSYSALELAKSGVGMALVQHSFARAYLDEGSLVKVFSHEMTYDESHYLLVPDRVVRPKPEALLFKDWLLEEIRC